MYFLLLLNLQETHSGAEDLLQKGRISLSISDVPACRNPVDLMTEQSIDMTNPHMALLVLVEIILCITSGV